MYVHNLLPKITKLEFSSGGGGGPESLYRSAHGPPYLSLSLSLVVQKNMYVYYPI